MPNSLANEDTFGHIQYEVIHVRITMKPNKAPRPDVILIKLIKCREADNMLIFKNRTNLCRLPIIDLCNDSKLIHQLISKIY